ncbi:hypothetical protein Ga0609869_003587 [Rhodovulum iodosum]|uniref:Uncharacterized protein n=1 Tax=Rhodovulum iodosum TaxID=68291 RepID=A0ABV3XYU3_9RHOB|nr:hypothetical protein [Rhodovulum robiginosum]RSK38871.1 hypothetical protein EJA01_01605 [Rhodovulum robiginosum]
MPHDAFLDFQPGLQSPALHLEPITPSDTADLARVTRALNVAGAGSVRVVTVTGQTGDIHVAAGIPFPIRVVRVLATGTTATGITGLS